MPRWMRRGTRVDRARRTPRRRGFEVLESRELLARFIVRSASDSQSDPATLRAAINDANLNPGPDEILFEIPSAGGPVTIFLQDALPPISEAVLIDGRSQDGYAGTPVVILSGSQLTLPSVDGLVVDDATGVEIVALSIQNMPGAGIRINGGSQNRVLASFIGIDETGVVPRPNQVGVVLTNTSQNSIGGTASSDERNVISGNDSAGIQVEGSGSQGNQIIGNLIGSNLAGDEAVGNLGPGILVDGAVETRIGLSLGLGGNLIVGSVQAPGIVLFGDASGTRITGNVVGLNLSRTAPLPNTLGGILLNGARSTTIGGAVADEGNVISGNRRSGIVISGISSTANLVQGNVIGLGEADADLGNAGSGIVLEHGTANNTIGGAALSIGRAPGNVISGNQEDGIFLGDESQQGSSGNLIMGNLIGTDSAGLLARPNDSYGIHIIGASTNNQIGNGTSNGDFGAPNVISGNASGGILLGLESTSTLVRGNFIGTDITGNVGLGNGGPGVLMSSSSGNRVGGTLATDANVIGGNSTAGISISGGSGQTIQRNLIGFGRTGGAIGNAGPGILVEEGAVDVTIGGTTSEAANFIGNNSGAGVRIPTSASLSSPLNVHILGNSIADNSQIGIDLADAGVTPNDDLDPDPGPNLIQNFPIIETAVFDGSEFVITGRLNSYPDNPFRIELFGNPRQFNEGNFLLGSVDVTTDSKTGDATFRLALPGSSSLPAFVTATATSPTRGTSEYSDAVAVLNEPLSFTVTNTNDSGLGSLRQAILNANQVPGVQTIDFAIPGAVRHIIAPITPLPAIEEAVILDATTQAGYGPNPIVELVGASLSSPGDGLVIAHSAAGTTIRGLAINRFAGFGIVIQAGSSGNLIEANYIGTDSKGLTALPNAQGGILLDNASRNTIGGASAALRNLISANTGRGGISIEDGSSENLVRNNYIGTDATGTRDLGNTTGVRLSGSGTRENTIGGTTRALWNVISGNRDGVIVDQFVASTLIRGNFIGTTADGLSALGNDLDGVLVEGAVATTIGGGPLSPANVISGNGSTGIHIVGAGGLIQGNYVGVNVTGLRALGNRQDGIFAESGARNLIIGGSGRQANVIAGNLQSNIQLYGALTTGNMVVGNWIGTNPRGTAEVLPAGAGQTLVGIFINGASANTIADNVISGHQVGLEILGARASANIVRANRIGTDSSGNRAIGNHYGVLVWNAPRNIIGDSDPAQANVISGNGPFGVRIRGTTASGNRVLGNRIGTNRAGTRVVPNGFDGVYLEAPSNQIVANVISGNGSTGVHLIGSWARRNVIRNNIIGLDATGLRRLGNGIDGIYVQNAQGNRIENNTISGNRSSGLQFTGAEASGNVALRNRIGTDARGQVRPGLGNDFGLFLNTSARNTVPREGGPNRNIIAGNRIANVVVLPAAPASSSSSRGSLRRLLASRVRVVPPPARERLRVVVS